MLHPLIAKHLTADDDCELWRVATTTLLTAAEASATVAGQQIYARIGCCHHWICPHSAIRWLADDGFAWPFGYDKTTTGSSYRALPELTWSELLKWTGVAWESARLGKRSLVYRVAIPGRTSRHLKAVIHTVWTPHSPTSREKVVQIHGFRKKRGTWTETAHDIVQPMTRRGQIHQTRHR